MINNNKRIAKVSRIEGLIALVKKHFRLDDER